MPDTEAAGSEEASPEYVRMLQAERYWWHRVESEHTFADATEAEAELIRAGRLLGHHHGGPYRRPDFQVDAATGEMLPVVTALLDAIRGYEVPADEVIMWLCTPSAYFEEQDEPVHHLQDPEGLIAAAHTRFGAQW